MRLPALSTIAALICCLLFPTSTEGRLGECKWVSHMGWIARAAKGAEWRHWQRHWHAKWLLLGKLWVCCCPEGRLVWVACQKWLVCKMLLRCGRAEWRLRPSTKLPWSS